MVHPSTAKQENCSTPAFGLDLSNSKTSLKLGSNSKFASNRKARREIKKSMRVFAGICTLLLVLLSAPLAAQKIQSEGFAHFGNFKRMMHTGDTAGQIELAQLDQSAGTWGVGALAGLKGEVIQVDGRILVSFGTDTEGRVQPPSKTDAAVLWASGKVAQWRQIQVPADMSQAEFEKFVSEQAAINKVDLKQPFVFRVTGGYTHLIWHVLTGEKSGHKAGGHGGHGHASGHANKRSDMKVFRNPSITGQLVAVYSGERLEGAVSHPGERFHVHYIDDAQTVSGHVDQYNVQKGALLWLPIR